MVYSEKAGRELAARSMHAGAREYLVLPFDQHALGKALDRARIGLHGKPRSAPKAPGDLEVFFGAKGGAGVTTIACNLAIALAREPGHSTLLIDLAVPLGDAALNLGIAADHSTGDALREAERLDGSLLQTFLARHRSGVFVLAAPSKVPEAEPSKAGLNKLIAVARQQFDHVIVDAGSRIDLMGTDLFQGASTVYLVTQAGISELRNSNRLISQFFGEAGPNLEIVLNRFAPHLQAGVNEEVVTKALGRPVRWKIPDDHDATRQMQSTGATLSPADSPISRLILEMAGSVAGHPVSDGDSVEETDAQSDVEQAFSPAVQDPDVSAMAETRTNVAPAITWPEPGPISYGTALSAAQLNATASVPGTLVFTPGPGYLLPPGTHTLWVTFTPAHLAEAAPLQAAITIAVSKAAPAIEWPTPPAIASGSALDATHLNAKASIPGEFVYQPAAGEVLAVGTHSLTVTFTPSDSANYITAQATVEATVAKQTPALEWRQPEAIEYGVALGAAQLNAAAPIPGAFVYNPSEGAVLAAGKHPVSVLFTPEDTANYEPAQFAVWLTVTRAQPVLSWAAPDPVSDGTAVGAAQLNATAPVPGEFIYHPASGEVLAPGSHTLSVTFTPADGLNYTSAHAIALLAVVETSPCTITWPGPAAISYGTPLSDAQLNAAAPEPGTFAYAPTAGNVLAPGRHRLSVTFTPGDLLRYRPVEAAVELVVEAPAAMTLLTEPAEPISPDPVLPEPELAELDSSAPDSFEPDSFEPVLLDPVLLETLVFEPVSREAARPVPSASAETGPPPDSQQETTASDTPPAVIQRETRTYRGAIYEKGEDGQWHLQQN
jgi:Flp pilus assembly CpaE family ATPase